MFAILIINKGEIIISIVTVFIKSCDKYGIGIDMNIHTYIIIMMFMVIRNVHNCWGVAQHLPPPNAEGHLDLKKERI